MTIASKALGMFRQLKVPILGIIENMSSFVCPHCGTSSAIFKHGGARRASERLGVPFLGEIPLDPVICQTGDRGTPIVASDPASSVAGAFRRIAATLAECIRAEAAAAPIIQIGQ